MKLTHSLIAFLNHFLGQLEFSRQVLYFLTLSSVLIRLCATAADSFLQFTNFLLELRFDHLLTHKFFVHFHLLVLKFFDVVLFSFIKLVIKLRFPFGVYFLELLLQRGYFALGIVQFFLELGVVAITSRKFLEKFLLLDAVEA